MARARISPCAPAQNYFSPSSLLFPQLHAICFGANNETSVCYFYLSHRHELLWAVTNRLGQYALGQKNSVIV
jgi:hypothetical protein